MRIFTSYYDVMKDIEAAIEANGTDVATADEFDIEAIADECFTYDSDRGGFVQAVDEGGFWDAVKKLYRSPGTSR